MTASPAPAGATPSADLTTPGPDDATAAALAGGVRPRRLGTLYVAEHNLRSMRSYGWTIVMTGIGNPVMYLLGIGLGLASFLDVPVGFGPDGPVPYVWFVAPALLATAVVTVGTEEFTYTVMGGFRWRRVFWAMNSSPVAPGQVVGGLVLAVAARMIFVSVAYTLVVALFGAVGDLRALLLLPLIGVLGGLAFGLPLLAYSASLTQDSGQFAAVQRFVFTPMFLFSGTFYPLDTLPTWLHWIGWISPIWHASELGRAASFGQATPGWLLCVHVLVLVALAVGGWFVGRRVFVGRLRG
ncbi:ABC transporter permease [Cellulomonas sp. P22]|uniref:ABC transporter permease n=1 Tax=Cellulomonas sp. P22 TaxID=3373189 RepID=UPI0037B85A6A